MAERGWNQSAQRHASAIVMATPGLCRVPGGFAA